MPPTTLLCLTLIGAAVAVFPGAVVSLSESGVVYLKGVFVPALEEYLADLAIPDIPFDEDGFTGTISAIKCANLELNNANVAFQQGVGVELQINGLSASCSADYSYKLDVWPHIPYGSGSVSISTSGATADLVVAAGDLNGHPQLQVVHCTANLGTLNLDFSGGLSSDILNLLKSFFQSDIKTQIQTELVSEVSSYIDTTTNQLLGNMSLSDPIPVPAPYNIASLEFGLTASPIVDTAFVAAGLQGEAVPVSGASGYDPPFTPNPLPNFTANAEDRYVQVFVSEYLFNTAAYVYFTAGFLVDTVTASEIPSSVPIALNTKSFSDISPTLASKYPNMPMEVKVAAVTSPLLTTATTAVNVSFTLDLAFDVLTTSGAVNAFTVGGLLSTTFTASIAGTVGDQVLTGHLDYAGCPVTLRNSTVGAISDLSLLSPLLDYALGTVFVSTANKFLAYGFPLPSVPGLLLLQPDITIGDGYLAVGADFSYTPPNPTA